MSTDKKYIPIINNFRGLAALSVCAFHIIVTSNGYFTDNQILDIFNFGRKGVQVFFIISGIVIPLSMINKNYDFNDLKNFLLRRLIRIEIPYLITLFLGVLYLYTRNYVNYSTPNEFSLSIKDIFLNAFYLYPFVENSKLVLTIFWTLAIEFQYYVFIALLFPLVLSGNKIYKFIFNLIIIALPIIINDNSFFSYWAPYFSLGIYYALYITKRYSIKEYITISLISCLLVYHQQGLVDLLIGISTITIIHLIPQYENKIFIFLGKISYSLYLTHTLTGKIFVSFCNHNVTDQLSKFSVIIIALILSILLAYLFWKVIEKPSQMLSKKINF